MHLPRGEARKPLGRDPGIGHKATKAVTPVKAAMASAKRRPVDRAVKPSLGDSWGKEVRPDYQSKDYRAAAYHMRQRMRELVMDEANANNPFPGWYKPYAPLEL